MCISFRILQFHHHLLALLWLCSLSSCYLGNFFKNKSWQSFVDFLTNRICSGHGKWVRNSPCSCMSLVCDTWSSSTARVPHLLSPSADCRWVHRRRSPRTPDTDSRQCPPWRSHTSIPDSAWWGSPAGSSTGCSMWRLCCRRTWNSRWPHICPSTAKRWKGETIINY